MKSNILKNIPNSWTQLSNEQIKNAGLVQSSDYELVGAFKIDKYILSINKISNVPDFLIDFIDFFENSKNMKNSPLKPIDLKMISHNEKEFLLCVFESNQNTLNVQIFHQNNDDVFSFVFGIENLGEFVFEKIEQNKVVQDVLNLI